MNLLKSPKDESPSDARTGHAFRDALRLLFIIVRGSTPQAKLALEFLPSGEGDLPECVVRDDVDIDHLVLVTPG